MRLDNEFREIYDKNLPTIFDDNNVNSNICEDDDLKSLKLCSDEDQTFCDE